jgi:hypothetical protein
MTVLYLVFWSEGRILHAMRGERRERVRRRAHVAIGDRPMWPIATIQRAINASAEHPPDTSFAASRRAFSIVKQHVKAAEREQVWRQAARRARAWLAATTGRFLASPTSRKSRCQAR